MDELVHTFERIEPEVIGRPLPCLWNCGKEPMEKSLGRWSDDLAESLKYVSPFKDQINLKIKGGWAPVEKPERKL